MAGQPRGIRCTGCGRFASSCGIALLINDRCCLCEKCLLECIDRIKQARKLAKEITTFPKETMVITSKEE